ncbi:MAG: 3-hydroxyacyl-CoA dehydrogenase NAD-binding domain-containing protein [Burkholderiaceae bacterium]
MSPATAHVVALGAGRMGRGLATALAYAGIRVTVLDARERTAQAQQALQQQGHHEVLANMQMLAQLGAFDAAHAQPQQHSGNATGAAGAAARAIF